MLDLKGHASTFAAVCLSVLIVSCVALGLGVMPPTIPTAARAAQRTEEGQKDSFAIEMPSKRIAPDGSPFRRAIYDRIAFHMTEQQVIAIAGAKGQIEGEHAGAQLGSGQKLPDFREVRWRNDDAETGFVVQFLGGLAQNKYAFGLR